jgi:hypothetical protein
MRILQAIAKLTFGPLFKPQFYILLGVVMFMVFSVALTQDRFTMKSGTTTKIITRQDDPRTYWGVEIAIAVLGAVSFGSGIYCLRRKQRR